VIFACDFACDKARTERGEGGRRGQRREHNEDAPALRRSSKLVIRVRFPSPRSHRDVKESGSQWAVLSGEG
jgi:hypothetical protein